MKKLSQAAVASMDHDDLLAALRTVIPTDVIARAVAYFEDKGRKGDYSTSDKLFAGSLCWQLTSEGHSKAHVAGVMKKHFTWVDTVTKKAVSARAWDLDDQLALAFLAQNVHDRDVHLISKGLVSTDLEQRKIAKNLFDFYVSKHMVKFQQLVHYFDLVLLRDRVIRGPFVSDAYSRNAEVLVQARSAERLAMTKSLRDQQFGRWPHRR